MQACTHKTEPLHFNWHFITCIRARYLYITEHLAGAQTVLLHRKLLLLLLLLFSCHCPHVLFACQVLERCRLQKRLSSGPAAPDSAVEHSAESDAAPQAGAGPEGEEEDNDSAASHSAGNQTPVKEQDLQAQVHTHTTQMVLCQRGSCHDITGRGLEKAPAK